MSLRLAMAVAVGLLFVGFTRAADPPKLQDNTPELLNVLFNQKAEVELDDVNNVTLFDLLNELSNKHKIGFSINDACFKAAGLMDSIKEKKPNVQATNIGICEMNLHQFLTQVLDSLGATYIVKGNGVEIVTVGYAARLAKAPTEDLEDGLLVMKEPLVCAVIKHKSLSESVELLASRYDLSIAISPQSSDAAALPVSARLLNLPADRAIEMLALQCDLRVVRKGTAFLVTSRENAKALLAEQADQARQTIDLDLLRIGKSRNAITPQQKSNPVNGTGQVQQPTEQKNK
jgi:hypothetical protein